jgi:adenylate kinase
MLNLVIFGAPGSGKGTQSERLIGKYNLRHISTGEVLRGHISRGTELGKLADTYISKGQLIPDQLMLDVLSHELSSLGEGNVQGVIFDGFPRTIEQAEAFEKLMEKHGHKLDAVIGLEVPEEELVDRMLKRGAATGRADDNLDTIKNRLEVYHAQTHPLKAFYTKRGLYRAINGAGDVDAIFGDIVKAIEA